jgi:hypothetical protein
MGDRRTKTGADVGASRRMCACVAIATLLLAGVTTAHSQQTRPEAHYGFHGFVRDSANVPVSSATVSVYGFAGSATTGGRGEFAVTGLMRGTRVLEVVAIGYKPRRVAIAVDDDMPDVVVVLARARVVMLDSVLVSDRRPLDMPITSRRTDRITEAELNRREIVGGSAFEAFALLRPQLFRGRPAVGVSSTNAAAQRAQLFQRDAIFGSDSSARVVCLGNRACEIDAMLSVSINEGRPGSPDILTTLPARIIKEMRYLLAVDASARFGISSAGGPVLVVYTR